MEAKIEGGMLVVKIPVGTPHASATGKTRIVASSGGGKATSVIVEGKPVVVNITAWIKN